MFQFAPCSNYNGTAAFKTNHQCKFKANYNVLMIFYGNIPTFFRKKHTGVLLSENSFLKLIVANIRFSMEILLYIIRKTWHILGLKYYGHMIFSFIFLIISTQNSMRREWFCFLFWTKLKRNYNTLMSIFCKKINKNKSKVTIITYFLKKFLVIKKTW